MAKKIGILGSGAVGITLANGFKSLGYIVTLANRTGHTVDGWKGNVSNYSQTAKDSEILVLAVKGSVAEDVITQIASHLIHKTVIDTTNPIRDTAPNNGVLSFFTNLEDSLMERLQKLAPQAHFVKAFNSVGSAVMINPKLKGGPPTMFICGNSSTAKQEIAKILKKLGWEAEDCGKATAARAIEPLCILWCIPGFLNNEWLHAFKLLKP